MEKLKTSTRLVEGVTIVDLSGRITLGEASVVVRDVINDLMGKGNKKILLNLVGVNYIDSSGIGVLVSSFSTVRSQGGELKLVNLSKRPAIFPSPDWAASGGLMSFGPDYSDATRHLIAQLDRVLKGAAPGDLPFERPTKFDLRVNLRAAKALGIELPATVLARADEVIE